MFKRRAVWRGIVVAVGAKATRTGNKALQRERAAPTDRADGNADQNEISDALQPWARTLSSATRYTSAPVALS